MPKLVINWTSGDGEGRISKANLASLRQFMRDDPMAAADFLKDCDAIAAGLYAEALRKMRKHFDGIRARAQARRQAETIER